MYVADLGPGDVQNYMIPVTDVIIPVPHPAAIPLFDLAARRHYLLDSSLTELADRIPQVLQDVHAKSTSAMYNLSFKNWSQWTQKYDNIFDIPADPYFVGLHLIFLADAGKSLSM